MIKFACRTDQYISLMDDHALRFLIEIAFLIDRA
jgi:hypothetical protein